VKKHTKHIYGTISFSRWWHYGTIPSKGLTAKRLNRNAMLHIISCIRQTHYVTLVMALLFTVRRPGYGWYQRL